MDSDQGKTVKIRMVLGLGSQQETPSCEKRAGHDGPPFVNVQSIIDRAGL